MDNSLKVISVIVTYNPDRRILQALIESCRLQVNEIIISDNGSEDNLSNFIAQLALPNLFAMHFGRNLGIAAAQNAGIELARQHGAHQIVLFDQDSAPPPDLVPRLQAALAELTARGEKVAAVGPNFIDAQRTGGKVPSSFRRFQDVRIVDSHPPEGSIFAPVDFLAASGTLIPITALDAIGNMNADLFIDYVDIEWGVRARQLGWAIYGVWDVIMQHRLGESAVVRFGRSIPVHSATRHYYVVRNAVWLTLHSDLLPYYRICIAYNGFRRFLAYALFMPNKLQHIRFMLIGAWDGIIGKLAAFDRKL